MDKSMKITMAHGSGGKSSAELMSEIFGRHFKNDILDRMEDAAVLDLGKESGAGTTSGTEPKAGAGTTSGSEPKAGAGATSGTEASSGAGATSVSEPTSGAGTTSGTEASSGAGATSGADATAGARRIACSTDSFVVTPLEFKGGDIGKLCVCGTVNDLLMMGAVPKYLTCGFILEEGLDVELLDRLVASMAAQAGEAGVTIVAGDTKVIGGKGGLYINTTGVGVIPEGRNVSSANAKPGDVIICSGNLGDHHACILSHRMDIQNDIKSDCAALGDIVEALFDAGIDVHTMRDVTRGGLGTVINEVAESSGLRADLEEEAIPVSDEVRGFAGILGLDPLYMGNEGKMIAIVPEEQAEAALSAMRKTEHGSNAAIIGKFSEGSGAYINTRLGASRRFDVLYGEGLPRIC